MIQVHNNNEVLSFNGKGHGSLLLQGILIVFQQDSKNAINMGEKMLYSSKKQALEFIFRPLNFSSSEQVEQLHLLRAFHLTMKKKKKKRTYRLCFKMAGAAELSYTVSSAEFCCIWKKRWVHVLYRYFHGCLHDVKQWLLGYALNFQVLSIHKPRFRLKYIFWNSQQQFAKFQACYDPLEKLTDRGV